LFRPFAVEVSRTIYSFFPGEGRDLVATDSMLGPGLRREGRREEAGRLRSRAIVSAKPLDLARRPDMIAGGSGSDDLEAA